MVTWSDLAAAGAFIVGVVAGALGALHAVRLAIDYLRRDDREAHK